MDQSLSTVLRDKILASAPGDKLPSVRALMKRYGASLYSVNLTLKQLAGEELIEVRHGSGIYVSARHGVRYIEFHRPQYPSRALDLKEISLANAVEKAGWRLLVKRHSVNGDTPDPLPNPKASAHVVIPTLFEAGRPFLEQIMRQSAPVLAYSREAGVLDLDFVTGNDHQYLSVLIKHFYRLGHRHLALLLNEPQSYEVSHKREMFLDIAHLFELPEPVVIECGTQPGENSMLKAHEGLCRYLAALPNGEPPFTALLVGSAIGVLGALRALHEAGVSVPADCSIGSLGMELENSMIIPSITEVGVPNERWGEGAVSVLQKRFADPSVRPISLRLEPSLIIRESSAPARDATPALATNPAHNA